MACTHAFCTWHARYTFGITKSSIVLQFIFIFSVDCAFQRFSNFFVHLHTTHAVGIPANGTNQTDIMNQVAEKLIVSARVLCAYRIVSFHLQCATIHSMRSQWILGIFFIELFILLFFISSIQYSGVLLLD